MIWTRAATRPLQSQSHREWRAKTNKNFPIKSQHLYSPHDPKRICIFQFVEKRSRERASVRARFRESETSEKESDDENTKRLHNFFVAWKLCIGNVLHFYLWSKFIHANALLHRQTNRQTDWETTTVIISWYLYVSFETRAPALSHRSPQPSLAWRGIAMLGSLS